MAEHKPYNHHQIEPRWRDYWLNADLFSANPDSTLEPFSIVIPPPNVTGSLHLGHALNNTLQDILCRYKRMKGFEVMWMPGTDHAGIATQNVVERQLASEGKNRRDLGREAFIKRVWEWKAQSGGQIINQLKRLGCSCDWKRERFTMDEGLSHVVREVFVRLYHEKLIYRGDYMINWCPRCESALADLEVEYPDEAEKGKIYELKYPIIDPAAGGPTHIVVETTRPETMLGDTAIAVHPDDDRYRAVVGKNVRLPLVDRIIPIVADTFADPQFGSGAVKITPGHDPNDFETGRRHNLPIVSVIGPDGKMTKDAGPDYQGLDRFKCREKIIGDLQSAGVLTAIKDHQLKTGRCYRCQTITEPLVSTQWFMRMRELADAAAAAVRDGQTRVVPSSWENVYFHWLDNIRDWCISRQLWWGHQIPVWYCSCGETIVSTEDPTSCSACGKGELRQDPDVLDTWFSSALWPFSTMGWPEQTPLLKKFYPTTVLVTGFDIIFFWVARMMMMALKLTDRVPFYDIYLHAMVRDEHGQKMSKTKGNVIDPLDIIEQYGADALRFTLAILTVQGRDVNLSTQRIEGYRNFINKIWNGIRYVSSILETVPHCKKGFIITEATRDTADADLYSRWIRSRLAKAVELNIKGHEEYQFSEACSANYRFFWDEFCAWYLEITKLQLRAADDAKRETIATTLLAVSDVSLRLMHPTVPFVTEELWSELPLLNNAARKSLSCENFPLISEFDGFISVDEESESQMTLLCDVVTAVRTIRAEKNIAPAVALGLYVEGASDETKLLREHEEIIKGLCRLERIDFTAAPEGCALQAVSSLRLAVPLAGAIDEDAERERVSRELKKVKEEIVRAEKKLGSSDFTKRAPQEIVEKEQKKLQEHQAKLQVLTEAARELGVV